jgi:tRNA uridine 5-carbamoylmethylation protein Kti12
MNKKVIINLVAGPSVGKSIFAAELFSRLKQKKYNAEWVPEEAKKLVWTENWDLLNNQHYVSKTQYELFKAIYHKVDIIVTDGSLLHGLYYNRYNEDNISNVEKTEKFIEQYFNEFNNLNIYLERNMTIPFQQEGRIQNLEESLKIDSELINILNEKNIKFQSFLADICNVDKMLKYIENKLKEI